MALEITSRRSYNNGDMGYINDSFNSEMSIYDQAHLIRGSALKKVYVIEKSSTEIGVIFKLEGELKGSVVCTLDLCNKEIAPSQVIFFQSLFMESMNILLGSFLTNLEELSNIMSVIASPKFLKATDQIPGEIADNISTTNVWQLNYRLLALNDQFDCKVYVVANRKQTIEV